MGSDPPLNKIDSHLPSKHKSSALKSRPVSTLILFWNRFLLVIVGHVVIEAFDYDVSTAGVLLVFWNTYPTLAIPITLLISYNTKIEHGLKLAKLQIQKWA